MASEFVLDYKELLNVTEMFLQLHCKFPRVTRSHSIRLRGLVGLVGALTGLGNVLQSLEQGHLRPGPGGSARTLIGTQLNISAATRKNILTCRCVKFVSGGLRGAGEPGVSFFLLKHL